MAAGSLSYQDLSKKWAPCAFYFWHLNIVDKILRKTLKKTLVQMQFKSGE